MASTMRWPSPFPESGGRTSGNSVVRVHYEEELAVWRLAEAVRACLADQGLGVRPWTVVCVGTDRSTGDALGPLVGDLLTRRADEGLRVFGTLEAPVHATNLADVLRQIRPQTPPRPVIAIDACLGQANHVGTVSVRRGPLHPGTGVNKTLPAVGDVHMVGVVNVGGFMEYFVLQNTRLHLVTRMAEVITASLLAAVAVGDPGSHRAYLGSSPRWTRATWEAAKEAEREAAGGQDAPWLGFSPPPE